MADAGRRAAPGRGRGEGPVWGVDVESHAFGVAWGGIQAAASGKSVRSARPAPSRPPSCPRQNRAFA